MDQTYEELKHRFREDQEHRKRTDEHNLEEIQKLVREIKEEVFAYKADWDNKEESMLEVLDQTCLKINELSKI